MKISNDTIWNRTSDLPICCTALKALINELINQQITAPIHPIKLNSLQIILINP